MIELRRHIFELWRHKFEYWSHIRKCLFEPFYCIPAVIGLLAVWRHNKSQTKNQALRDAVPGSCGKKIEKNQKNPYVPWHTASGARRLRG